MSAWYDNSVFYHMYPLGMTGAPRENHETETADRFRFYAALNELPLDVQEVFSEVSVFS